MPYRPTCSQLQALNWQSSRLANECYGIIKNYCLSQVQALPHRTADTALSFMWRWTTCSLTSTLAPFTVAILRISPFCEGPSLYSTHSSVQRHHDENCWQPYNQQAQQAAGVNGIWVSDGATKDHWKCPSASESCEDTSYFQWFSAWGLQEILSFCGHSTVQCYPLLLGERMHSLNFEFFQTLNFFKFSFIKMILVIFQE